MLFGDKIFINRPHERRPRRLRTDSQSSGPLLTKRRKFVITSVILSIALSGIQALNVENRYAAIGGFAVLSYLLTVWCMYRDLRGVQWLSNMILPTLYPVAVALFYFLLPQEVAVRVGINILFAVTMYALLLTTNIYGVASIRTIQLLRAAHAVGFLLTILTSAFLFHVIFALRLSAFVVGVLVFVVSWLIFYQGVWTHTLSITGERREFIYTLIGSLILLQGSLALSFWLIDVPLASIMLSMMVYVLLGLFQQDLEQRLFARTIQEYTGFAAIVFAVIVVTVMYKWIN